MFNMAAGQVSAAMLSSPPGRALLQDSLLKADHIPLPAHAPTQGLPLQPTEPGPCHADLAPPHAGVKVEAEADLLHLPSQGCQLKLI